MQNSLKGPVTAPLLKPSVTSLIRRITTRKIFPGSSGSKNPQNAIKHIPWITPGSPPAIVPLLRLRQKRLNELPLFFGEIHAIPLRGGPVTTAREFGLRGSE